MNKKSRILSICASIFALTLLLSGSSPAQTAAPLANSKDVCLQCHGPYDKLVFANTNYNGWEAGETTSPHRYVPHDSKDIPECSNCHKPHPVPLTSTEGLPKPNGTWCYGCHHKRVLKCGTCH